MSYSTNWTRYVFTDFVMCSVCGSRVVLVAGEEHLCVFCWEHVYEQEFFDALLEGMVEP